MNNFHLASGGNVAGSLGTASTGAGMSTLGKCAVPATWVVKLYSVVQPAHFLAWLVRSPSCTVVGA